LDCAWKRQGLQGSLKNPLRESNWPERSAHPVYCPGAFDEITADPAQFILYADPC